jgi:hypothetical protein
MLIYGGIDSLMFCSYTSINVRVKYQIPEVNLRAEEQMKDNLTFC